MTKRDRKSDLWLPSEPWVIREGVHTPDEEWDFKRVKDALGYFTACQRRLKDAIDQTNERLYEIERAILRLERVQSDEARSQLDHLRRENHVANHTNGRYGFTVHDLVRAGVLFLPVWVLFEEQLTRIARVILEAIGWTF